MYKWNSEKKKREQTTMTIKWFIFMIYTSIFNEQFKFPCGSKSNISRYVYTPAKRYTYIHTPSKFQDKTLIITHRKACKIGGNNG